MKIKRSITVTQAQIETDKYRVVSMKNMTDYTIGQTVTKVEVDTIIQGGVEVHVKGGK